MALLSGCCFTGHRPQALPGGGNPADPGARRLLLRLRETVELLSSQGMRDFYCGGALGFDTWAARAVLEQKASTPAVRLHLVIPHWGQESGWSRAEDVYKRQAYK